MEEQTYAPAAPPEEQLVCATCKSVHVVPGHATLLCANCRKFFVKYPVPVALWIFAGIIAAVLVFSLYKLPKNFEAALHLSRAQNALESRHYHQVHQEAREVTKLFPDHQGAHSLSLLAAAYNLDHELYATESRFLDGQEMENKDIEYRVREAKSWLASLVPGDALSRHAKDYLPALSAERQAGYFDSLAHDDRSHNNVACCAVIVANLLIRQDQLKEARRILEKAQERCSRRYAVELTLAEVYRRSGKFDYATSLYDKMMKSNMEDANVLAGKARVEMLQQRFKTAEQLAKEAVRLQPLNGYALASQALLLHAQGRKAESWQLLGSVAQLDALSGDSSNTQQLRQVLEGKTVYR